MKQDISSDIIQNFNPEAPNIQPPEPPLTQKSRRKKIIIISLIVFLSLAIITTVVLLVCHYKYDLFGESEGEIYQVTDVKRELYSEEYYTETKTIKSKLSYTGGELDERVQKVVRSFVVLITDKEQLPENITLNTATLIILQAYVEMEGKQVPLNSFNFSDENTVEEFEKDPNGLKYPMAIIRYYDNATIKDINLPKDMDKETADSIIDLVDDVMPKLVRNKTEDEKNGIEIDKGKKRKRRTLKMKGRGQRRRSHSRIKRLKQPSNTSYTVERDVENNKIKEIRTKSDSYFHSKNDTNNSINFGIKDFYFNTSSVIVSDKNVEKRVNDVNLIKKLTSKLEFIEAGELLNSILEKEKEELDKNVNEIIQEELNQTLNKTIGESNISNYQLRNLGWDGSFGWDWKIASANILGQEIDFIYSISLGGGEVENSLTIDSDRFSFSIGNVGGVSSNTKKKNVKSQEREVGRVPLGAVGISLSLKIGSSVGFAVEYKKKTNTFKITFQGEVYATAGVCLGWDLFASLEAGVKGTFAKFEFTNDVEEEEVGEYAKKNVLLTAKAGGFSAYAYAKILFIKVFDAEVKIWDGWGVIKITW